MKILKSGELTCQLWIPDNKKLFNTLYSCREEIENSIGYSLKWDYKEGSKASSIDVVSDFKLDLSGSNFNNGYEWLLKKSEDYKSVFKKYL